MQNKQTGESDQFNIIEKQAFQFASKKSFLIALEKLDEAMKINKQWYHFFYKAIWLHNCNQITETAKVILYGLNYDQSKAFFFHYLSADFLFRTAIAPPPNTIETTDRSIIRLEQALGTLTKADDLLFQNKLAIEIDRNAIPQELKDLSPTFLNDKDFHDQLQDLRINLSMARQSLILFKGMVQTETRINTAIEKNRERIDSERVRTIELLGIFTAIFAFIFSGIQIFAKMPLRDGLVLQGGMALMITVFFLGIRLVIDAESRTKLLTGIFIVLVLLLLLYPKYARVLDMMPDIQIKQTPAEVEQGNSGNPTQKNTSGNIIKKPKGMKQDKNLSTNGAEMNSSSLMGSQINWNINMMTFCVAVSALWLAVRESRKTSCVLFKIKKCSFEERRSVSENNQNMFSEFRIVLQNRGISLHRVCMSLTFAMEKGGTVIIPLTCKGHKECKSDEFARGMIGEFYLKSYELDEGKKRLLCKLKSSKKQDAHLCIYSQDYLAKHFLIGRLLEGMKIKWNSLAIRVNARFKRRVGANPEGIPVVKHYRIFPVLNAIKPNIMSFIESLQGR